MAGEQEGEMQLSSNDVADIPGQIARVRQGFRSHKTLPRAYREQQLKNLKRLMRENSAEILQALRHDLRKNENEAEMMETNICMNNIIYTLDNLEEWMAPDYKPKGLADMANTIYTVPEPYGVVLVIAPWNYPIQLMILPLIGAIAAGNACVLKPSESAVACSNLMAELISRYLDNECYPVITGGTEVSQALLKERFDYILYTGSTQVGKIVMESAAKNLTPVTLELGGKSPVIIADDADIDIAAKRIMWGKFLNTGQTCIAPDYILCPRDKQEKLVQGCKKALKDYYGEDPKSSKDYGRIINDRHFQRLTKVLKGTKGKVVHGGEQDADEAERYIPPTLITHVTPDDVLMEDEIFGPLLPFLGINNVDEAIKFVNDREKPLAFYVFAGKSTFDYINQRTSAGGVCHNDTLMHANALSLPFGGVGHSGMGAYHFKYSFQTFSHYKPVFSTGTGMEFLNQMVRVPPFSKSKMKKARWLMTPPSRRSLFLWTLLKRMFILCSFAIVVHLFLQRWLKIF